MHKASIKLIEYDGNRQNYFCLVGPLWTQLCHSKNAWRKGSFWYSVSGIYMDWIYCCQRFFCNYHPHSISILDYIEKPALNFKQLLLT